jgi:hypothetical protein
MKELPKRILLILFCICISARLFTQVTQVTATVTANSPVDPFIRNYVMSPLVGASFTSPRTYYAKITGKITCISPASFTITANTGLQRDLMQGANILPPDQRDKAFGEFIFDNLALSGINEADIADPSGIRVGKLPDGNYSICFTAIDPTKDSLLATQCAFFTIATCTQRPNGTSITTIVTPPINPIIAQSISAGSVKSSILFINPPTCSTQVRLYGKIERLSPSSFSIALDSNYKQQSPITINPGVTQLTPNQMMGAFDNFNDGNLLVSGINLASLKDANNRIKLPDGDYRICFYAKYISGGDASNPNLGCGSFKICNQAGGAPQFTQPISNSNINSVIAIVQPVSPVIFSWTPPQSTCGLPPAGYTYDFDIWELYPNQTVTDAVNNPFVFRKISLPSTTFLLDLNLYKDVLKQGKRYAIRVRAISNNPASPVEIDNNGYSRIEAFQYGGNFITRVPDPQDYFIQIKERKSSFWDDVYLAHQQRRQSDTLVPIKEYIAFALTKNGIAYGLDAIELFLTLNPELTDVKKVKISYAPNLPVFPLVSANDQKNFNKEHEADLEPDKLEENKFLKYLDTLKNYKQKIPANAVTMINDLVSHLNSIKTEISTVDRVTVNFINNVLAELLYQLRLYSRNSNTSQYNQLQNLFTTLKELTAESLNSTSFFYLSPEKIISSVSSYLSGPNENISNISVVDSLQSDDEIESLEKIPVAVLKQLLSFDVIVWRAGTVEPFKPVFDAPDLKGTFRIFYTLRNLYNHKNPEVNAKTSPRLASTIQVSVPSNSVFSFWTLNMVNHRTTTANDIDPRDVLKNSMKKEPHLKKPSIVLKVD